MLFNVVERVLGNVGVSATWVLAYVSSGWFQFTSKKFDHGGFSGTVGANNGNTGRHVASDGNVRQLRLGGTWVGEVNIGHGQNGSRFVANTFQHTRQRKFEFQVGRSKLEVRFRFWETLYKRGNVTFVGVQFQVLEVDDVVHGFVQEKMTI